MLASLLYGNVILAFVAQFASDEKKIIIQLSTKGP